MQEIEDRDLGWGPRTRHLDFFYTSRCPFGVEIMLQAGGLRVYIYIQGDQGSKGRHTINFTAILIQVEAWYKR
jgi:hypothetical protein